MIRPALSFLIFSTASLSAADFTAFLDAHCLECHDSAVKKGDLDLSHFSDEAAVMQDRSIWRAVYEKIESHQMPPPKQKTLPTDAERQEMMAWIMDIASRPDPALGAADPGKPTLRRLTRLEYNNAVRDLFGLEMDIFAFSERLPYSDKSYFEPGSGAMGDRLAVPMREYGQKYPVLCRQLGLPGDSRAEHGYRNRGDAMDFSPLLLEKYLAAALEIVNAPELPSLSPVAAELFGVKQTPLSVSTPSKVTSKDALHFAVTGTMNPSAVAWRKAEGIADNSPDALFEDITEAFAVGRGGVFTAGDEAGGVVIVPGKGGKIHLTYAEGAKALTINPDADLWTAPFATVSATSGKSVLANHVKGEKTYELTFGVNNGATDELLTRLAVFVPGRKSQSGQVTLIATFTDGTEEAVTADIAEGPSGTTLYSFAAVPGEGISSLRVDGSAFSGDYVVLDDLAFLTNGVNETPSPAPVKQTLPPVPVTATETGAPVSRLTAFMERAYRRAVSEEEMSGIHALFEAAREESKSETEAMKAAVAAVFASPAFLYVEANGTPGGTGVSPLEDHELATRLALFLWSSTPDDELLGLAKNNRLHDPVALEAQVRRMLKDPRARELGESFAVQWLRLDQLFTSQPDRDLYQAFYSGPQGKSTLHGSMLTEALLLFETVLVEDRSIMDFIRPDYTWLNPRLAALYRIPLPQPPDATEPAAADGNREVKKKDNSGSQWQRVTLNDPVRGGYLGMAAPMVVTSLPFRTSPVKRGAWMLETIFNRPPTEPKVAFAIENDTREAAQQMSIREKFEAHRNKAACHSCHIRLDPPGFALERFSPIGAWRETDGTQPVDATGEWSGRSFDGPAGFKAILADDPHEFTRGFIEHLLSYAIARELEVHDMPVVERIQHAAEAEGWKLSRVITEIAKSYPFTHVRQ